MKNKKHSPAEALFYNNKFLLVFSILISIVLWATVKINYSADTVRTVSDVRVSLTNTLSEGSDYVYFVDDEKLYVDVEISGKAYNINSNAISKDDIIVESNGTYVDSSGYKVLTLSARLADGTGMGDVKITSVSPSTIAVYYDRKATRTFNVEAKLLNDLDSLVEGDYTVGQPAASLSTVDITGPVTMLNSLKNVYFTAEIDEEDLPLTASKEIRAEMTFAFESGGNSDYLTCESINDESNPATVTVPVFLTSDVATSVKFVNQPGYYTDSLPEISISPASVEIFYNPKDGNTIEELYVGTVDFRNISNTVNRFSFPVDENLGVNIVDKSLEEFTVEIDMSSLTQKTLDTVPGKIVYLNQYDDYDYTIDTTTGNLGSIVLIGPAKSLEAITADDIQIEINVSSLDLESGVAQTIEVSNISIQNDDVNDCWVYGKYTALITATAK